MMNLRAPEVVVLPGSLSPGTTSPTENLVKQQWSCRSLEANMVGNNILTHIRFKFKYYGLLQSWAKKCRGVTLELISIFTWIELVAPNYAIWDPDLANTTYYFINCVFGFFFSTWSYAGFVIIFASPHKWISLDLLILCIVSRCIERILFCLWVVLSSLLEQLALIRGIRYYVCHGCWLRGYWRFML